jgi:hypothetical protein
MIRAVSELAADRLMADWTARLYEALLPYRG